MTLGLIILSFFFFSSSAGFILVVRVNKYFIYTLTKKGGVELLLYRLSI